MDAPDSPEIETLDAEQFLDLLSRHEAQIMGFIWSISGIGPDAEDLFQQSSLLMWQKLGDYRQGSNFVAWACQIARYKALELSRKRKRLLLLDHEVIERLAVHHGEEDYELRLLRRRALSNCLLKLPEKDRELVESCYRGEQSIGKVAEEIGRTARSVYKSLARIRKVLLQCIRMAINEECA
jgi:RNA polymerase sigma-70 factor (ECF subfamily)